ncbi:MULTISPECIES: hypothetical protein [Xenorhabdus]|uniref:hypothetical protein n=1 Tax=Xenorhabdus TaxID=626 RepID=UPI0030D0D29C
MAKWISALLANEIEVLAHLYLKVLPIMKTAPILSPAERLQVLEKFKSYELKIK